MSGRVKPGCAPAIAVNKPELQCPNAAVLRARDEVYRRLFADITADLGAPY